MHPVDAVKWQTEVIKIFMFNSAEHDISNAHNYKKYQEIQHFPAQISWNAIFPAHKC